MKIPEDYPFNILHRDDMKMPGFIVSVGPKGHTATIFAKYFTGNITAQIGVTIFKCHIYDQIPIIGYVFYHNKNTPNQRNGVFFIGFEGFIYGVFGTGGVGGAAEAGLPLFPLFGHNP